MERVGREGQGRVHCAPCVQGWGSGAGRRDHKANRATEPVLYLGFDHQAGDANTVEVSGRHGCVLLRLLCRSSCHVRHQCQGLCL